MAEGNTVPYPNVHRDFSNRHVGIRFGTVILCYQHKVSVIGDGDPCSFNSLVPRFRYTDTVSHLLTISRAVVLTFSTGRKKYVIDAFASALVK